MGANGEVSRGVTMTERSTAGGPLLDRNVGRRMGWLRRWLTKRELRKQIRYYWKMAEFAWYAGNEESVERHTAYAKNLQKKLDELNYCGKTPNLK